MATLLVGCASEPTPWLRPFVERSDGDPAVSVVAYGTSLTADGGWFDAVAAELDRQYPDAGTFTNAAEGARYSVWALEQLDARVLVAEPDLVFLEFAVNDAYLPYDVSVEQSQENLRELVRRLRAARPSVPIIVLMTNVVIGEHATARPELAAYYDAWRATAGELDLGVVELEPAWLHILEAAPEAFDRLMPDGIHPSFEGHRRVNAPLVLAFLRGQSVDPVVFADEVIASL
jgi:lysophospholipase L1-like esterase